MKKNGKNGNSGNTVTGSLENLSREELIALVKDLSQRRKFGLVWEDKPEEVAELCEEKLPVLKEVVERHIPRKGLGVRDEGRGTRGEKQGGMPPCQKTHPSSLPPHPSLLPDDGSNLPTHLIIEGDNYHSLSVLNYTHPGKVDVIYIDPPYNTGAKDWMYNNDYVEKDDAYRHSKWLSFMEKRLVLAKNLLKETGFLICTIDANELCTLGLLLNDIFGENNRLGIVTVLHNPKGRNFTRWFSANSEYMLVYAKNANNAAFNEIAIDEDIKASFDLTEIDGRKYRLEPFMRSRTETLRENKPKFWYPIYVSDDLLEITRRKKSGFHEVYPIASTGKEATWINLPETFDEKVLLGWFVAKRENGKIQIYRKLYEQQILKNVWTDKKYQSEFNGTNLLKEIIGNNDFPYPKSLYAVLDILKITCPRPCLKSLGQGVVSQPSVILDFFAGSGTTGHAVLELNASDGGHRQFILCTNNENGIAENVTYPRIKKVIEGYADKEGIPAEVRYFQTEFVEKDKEEGVTDAVRYEMVDRSTDMLKIRENTFTLVERKVNPRRRQFEIYTNVARTKYTAVIYDTSAIEAAKSKIAAVVNGLPVAIYIFTLGDDSYDGDFDAPNWRVEPLPERILQVYRRLFRGK